MVRWSVLIAVLSVAVLMSASVARADDEEDEAAALFEQLGGSSPEVTGDSGEEPSDEPVEEDPPLSFAEGGSLPGDLSELLEGYVDESGDLTEEAAVSATEEVQESASSDDARGQALRDALDSNNDGEVDRAEAQAGVDRARQVRQQMRQRAGEMFFKHDEDANGELDIREFAAMAQEMQVPNSNNEAAVQAMFGQIDTDQSGAISAGEAQQAAAQVAAAMSGQRGQRPGQGPGRGDQRPGRGQGNQEQIDPVVLGLTQQVMQLDSNGDGMIGPREAANNLLVAANFNAADANGDQRLSPEEIYRFIRSQQGQ